MSYSGIESNPLERHPVSADQSNGCDGSNSVQVPETHDVSDQHEVPPMSCAHVTEQRPVSLVGWGLAIAIGLAGWALLFRLLGL